MPLFSPFAPLAVILFSFGVTPDSVEGGAGAIPSSGLGGGVCVTPGCGVRGGTEQVLPPSSDLTSLVQLQPESKAGCDSLGGGELRVSTFPGRYFLILPT